MKWSTKNEYITFSDAVLSSPVSVSSSSNSTLSSLNNAPCVTTQLLQPHHQTHSSQIPNQVTDQVSTQTTSNLFQHQTYFQSKEARNIFGYSSPKNKEEKNIDVIDTLYERIIKFHNSVFTYSEWRELMEDNGKENKCGEKCIHNTKVKSKYLFHILSVLLDRKESELPLTWQKCCEEAIEKVKLFEGANLIENDNPHHYVVARTIMKWFRNFIC